MLSGKFFYSDFATDLIRVWLCLQHAIPCKQTLSFFILLLLQQQRGAGDAQGFGDAVDEAQEREADEQLARLRQQIAEVRLSNDVWAIPRSLPPSAHVVSQRQ